MGYVMPNVAQVNTGRADKVSWEYSKIYNSEGVKDWLIIPDQIQERSILISFSGGASGKIQHTLSLVTDIKDDNAIEEDWPFGIVNKKRSETFRAVRGIRAVMYGTGAMKIEVTLQ